MQFNTVRDSVSAGKRAMARSLRIESRGPRVESAENSDGGGEKVPIGKLTLFRGIQWLNQTRASTRP